MSKLVKELVRKEMLKRFEGLDSLAVVDFTGIDATTTNEIRGRLRQKDIRVTVVKNSIARRAFQAVGLPQASDLLNGPCAVAFAGDAKQVSVVSVIRELLEIGRATPALTVKAAVLEGEVFSEERIPELSRFPTRAEAVARTVACALSPGAKLAGCLIGPGRLVAGLLKAIQESKETEGGGEEQAA